MQNLQIKLPQELHSHKGIQKDVYFDLRKSFYTINGESHQINLKPFINKGIEGWSHSVMNNFILVTLYFKEDIIK